MEFTVWDIGGPASMATVNQCFFTDKALYVVVWNLALGEEAVASLQFWLLNIEVRGPRPPAFSPQDVSGVGWAHRRWVGRPWVRWLQCHGGPRITDCRETQPSVPPPLHGWRCPCPLLLPLV